MFTDLVLTVTLQSFWTSSALSLCFSFVFICLLATNTVSLFSYDIELLLFLFLLSSVMFCLCSIRPRIPFYGLLSKICLSLIRTVHTSTYDRTAPVASFNASVNFNKLPTIGLYDLETLQFLYVGRRLISMTSLHSCYEVTLFEVDSEFRFC